MLERSDGAGLESWAADLAVAWTEQLVVADCGVGASRCGVVRLTGRQRSEDVHYSWSVAWLCG